MAEGPVFHVKRLFFDRIFEKSYWVWRKHPAIIVPSMLGTAISVIEQSILTTGLIVFLVVVAAGGTLPELLSQFTTLGLSSSLLFNQSYSPLLFTIVTVSGIGYLLTAVISRGFVYSSEFGIYMDAWKSDEAKIGSIITHGVRNWKRMTWTLLLSNIITWGPIAAVLSILIGTILSASSTTALIGVAISSNLLYAAVGASLILGVFTVYTYPAVVIDNLSGMRAIRHSFNVASHNLGVTVGYSIVRVLFQAILLLIVYLGGLVLLPLSSFSAAILSLALMPVLHSTKAMVYYYARPEVPEMPFEVTNPIWIDISRKLPRAVWLKIRAGLREIGGFVAGPRNLPFHLLSVLAFAIGVFFGNFVSVNGLKSFLVSIGYVPGRGNPTVVFPRVIPPVLGADIFLNNWLVSMSTGLAGLGFGAPSFATILFNGFILGILLPLSSLTMFMAAILPHGIIEIPSFIVAGSMGIKLGYAGLRKLTGAERGDATNSSIESGDIGLAEGYLSRTLKQTVYVVVGLAPLFLIAGLIEADITPIIMRMFGWTF